MKHITTLLALALLPLAAGAQTAVPAAGGTAEGGGYALTYSVGQVATAADGQLREGVVQPLSVEEVGIPRAADLACTLTVFPNPATEGITLSRDGAETAPAEVRLYSLDGRLLRSEQWQGPSLALDLRALAAGVYMLQTQGRTFKITKQ